MTSRITSTSTASSRHNPPPPASSSASTAHQQPSVRRNLFHHHLSRRPPSTTTTTTAAGSSTNTSATTTLQVPPTEDHSADIVIRDRNGNYDVEEVPAMTVEKQEDVVDRESMVSSGRRLGHEGLMKACRGGTETDRRGETPLPGSEQDAE